MNELESVAHCHSEQAQDSKPAAESGYDSGPGFGPVFDPDSCVDSGSGSDSDPGFDHGPDFVAGSGSNSDSDLNLDSDPIPAHFYVVLSIIRSLPVLRRSSAPLRWLPISAAITGSNSNVSHRISRRT